LNPESQSPNSQCIFPKTVKTTEIQNSYFQQWYIVQLMAKGRINLIFRS
jgi:hypothetical protein